MAEDLPQVTERHDNSMTDSNQWYEINHRPNDVVLCGYAKCGTTWAQNLIYQLLTNGDENDELRKLMLQQPWVDMQPAGVWASKQEKLDFIENMKPQKGYRHLKAHIPLTALPYYKDSKYIYVTRNPRDVVMSLWNFIQSMHPPLYKAMGMTDKDTFETFMPAWLTGERDFPGFPPFTEHVASYWKYRHLPNVLFLHFNEMKSDLEGSLRKVQKFLDIEVPEEAWPRVVEHCGFAYMKANESKFEPPGDLTEKNKFLNSGKNDQWKEKKDFFTPELFARAQEWYQRTLPPEGIKWMLTGEYEE